MAWRPRSTTISKNSETSPISAYPIPLTIFQPAKNGDFLTGGNSIQIGKRLSDVLIKMCNAMERLKTGVALRPENFFCVTC